jgi:hypothetical protein
MHCIKNIKNWILLKNYEYEQMKDTLWSHSWRLGVHIRWLDFKDLEQKKEARIENLFLLWT